tara:strand:+ start:1342 stop:1752 length:411 start_codon:yes stop_codon:yes gene_type:complete
MAYKQPGWSAFTQKSKSGKKDEDRRITAEEVGASHHKKYLNTMEDARNNPDMTQNKFDALNEKSYKQYNVDRLNSLDSITNRSNIDLEKWKTNAQNDPNMSQNRMQKEYDDKSASGRFVNYSQYTEDERKKLKIKK